ncbi:unnamed protein product [Chondrus crispus]|uniref:Uncharacterized protein n=1 Tax=Chondrus crispus TaxID=2769 RepID=R7QP05_CHOCR|nr:unnamed protein product [Chondrus crispus]CDF39483.1 unnamed protein product [Chondrus crispus]|eukprot:XP_005719394.1 unnamed protein product [Chondrus crispus]
MTTRITIRASSPSTARTTPLLPPIDAASPHQHPSMELPSKFTSGDCTSFPETATSSGMLGFALPVTLTRSSFAHRSGKCRQRGVRTARPRTRIRCVAEPPAEPPTSPDAIRALITSEGKADQQRGLLLVRKLPPAVALELLLLSIQTSTNEFIRSTAAITIGQLQFPDPATASAAVDALVSLLATDTDYSVRSAAAAGMGYVVGLPDDALAALHEALARALIEDSEWQVQLSCLASLGHLKDERAVPILLRWMDSDNDLLVQASIGAMGDIGDLGVVPDLLKVLGSKDMMTRQRLAHSLGQMKDARHEPSVIDALRILSKDQSFAVRDAAKEALTDFGCMEAAKPDSMSDDERLDLEVANLLEGDEGRNVGASASEAMRRRLERSFDKEYVEDPDAFSSVAKRSNTSQDESEDDDREQNIVDPEVAKQSDAEFEDLMNDLKHGEHLDQTMAGIRLRKFDGKRVSKAVLEAGVLDASRFSERVRSLCVTLLARGGELWEVISVLMGDPDQNVRSACCDAIAEIGGGSVGVEACLKAFKTDKHWLVRVSAAIALGSIGKGFPNAEQELMDSLLPGGVEGLESPQDSVVRRHAVTALGFLGSEKCLPVIRALLNGEDSDTAIRYRIAGALRGIHCKESAALVRTLVHDGDNEVSGMAQGTLDALAQYGFS